MRGVTRTSSSSPARLHLLGLSLLVTLALAFSWLSPQITAPNERSRLLLTLSILESGTISVNDQIAQYGEPFDIAERDGKFYTDKAPGSSIAALPAVATYKAFADNPSIEQITNFARKFAMIPFAILGFLLVRGLLLGSGVRPSIASRTAVAFAAGTPFLHYGASVYGHALVATAAVGAAFALQKSLARPLDAPRWPWQFACGLIGGVCFAMEYQAAVLCIALAIAYLTIPEHRSLKSIIAPAIGAAIPISLVLLYNAEAFGGPLETSYGHLHNAKSTDIHSKGLFGITLPRPEAIYGLLLSPSRGILFCAPVVAAGLLATPRCWRRARWLTTFVGIGSLLYFLVASGTDVWSGGWSFGPRFLVPIFALAAIPAGLLLDHWTNRAPIRAAALRAFFAAGVLYNGTVTLIFPEIPDTFTNPLRSVALPLLELGEPSPNIGLFWLGLEGAWSIAPGLALIASLAAYICLAPAQAAVEGRNAVRKTWVRHALAAAAVLLVFGALVSLYPEQNPPEDSQRWIEKASRYRDVAN